MIPITGRYIIRVGPSDVRRFRQGQGGDLAGHNHMVLHSHSFCRPLEADAYHLLTTLMCGVYAFGIAEIAKAYSAALNNQKSCVVSLPEPLSPPRYHKPSPGRIGCEECCCHLTTSYLVGVRDYGGRHDRCSGRRHQGKHQSEENKELAHVSLTCHCFAALWRRRTDRSICVRSTDEDEIVEALDNVE